MRDMKSNETTYGLSSETEDNVFGQVSNESSPGICRLWTDRRRAVSIMRLLSVFSASYLCLFLLYQFSEGLSSIQRIGKIILDFISALLNSMLS